MTFISAIIQGYLIKNTSAWKLHLVLSKDSNVHLNRNFC